MAGFDYALSAFVAPITPIPSELHLLVWYIVDRATSGEKHSLICEQHDLINNGHSIDSDFGNRFGRVCDREGPRLGFRVESTNVFHGECDSVIPSFGVDVNRVL